MKKKIVHITSDNVKTKHFRNTVLCGAKYGGENGLAVIPLAHVEEARTEIGRGKKFSRFCCKCNKILKTLNNNSH